MESYNESELFDDQMNNLEDELQELLNKAEIVLGYKSENINQIVEDLLSKNTENCIYLATNIMDIEEDMIITEEYFYENDSVDDSFINLYDEDSDLSS